MMILVTMCARAKTPGAHAADAMSEPAPGAAPRAAGFRPWM